MAKKLLTYAAVFWAGGIFALDGILNAMWPVYVIIDFVNHFMEGAPC